MTTQAHTPLRIRPAPRGLFGLLIVALLIAGCARMTPPAVLITDAANVDFEESLGAAFARGAALLSGVDDPDAELTWRAGDRLLYGIHQQSRDSAGVWFVLVELLACDVPVRTEVFVLEGGGETASGALPEIATDAAPPGRRVLHRAKAPPWGVNFRIRDVGGRVRPVSVDSTSIFARLRVYDAEAKWIGDSYAFAPQDFLREGLVTHVLLTRELMRGLPGGAKLPVSKMSDEQLHQAVRATAGVFAVGRTLWLAPPLTPIFDGMVVRPSLLSIIANLGVRVSVDMRAQDAAEDSLVAERLRDGLRAYHVPLEVKINGKVAMRTDLVVAEPRPPLHLCAGIIGLDVMHLESPDRRLVARLLAARRGAAAESRPAELQ